MTRASPKLLILIVLLGVMIAVYVRAFRPAAPSSSDAPSQAAPPPAGDEAVQRPPASDAGDVAGGRLPGVLRAERSARRDAQRQRARLLSWRRDPFVREGASLGGQTSLHLTGILWDPQAPLAIINGQTLQVGEELDGWRIVAILEDRVAVTDGEQTVQLRLGP
jgi:hypothetical protein